MEVSSDEHQFALANSIVNSQVLPIEQQAQEELMTF
jgi:hypothetical protein